MSDSALSLTAHLIRRAGFGTTRGELEEYASRSYDDLVDELLDPASVPDVDEDVLQRYYPELTHKDSLQAWSGRWIYRMVNSRAPLRDKMALFWHQVFATAWHKSEHTPCMIDQIESFRRVGMSDLRTILLELSRDPGMVFWLDNCENFSAEPNENYGRELLELFSMGVGNYTEQDLKMAARAFTGWTFAQPIPLYPYGHYEPEFKYVEEEHDGAVKTFLGETGRFGRRGHPGYHRQAAGDGPVYRQAPVTTSSSPTRPRSLHGASSRPMILMRSRPSRRRISTPEATSGRC